MGTVDLYWGGISWYEKFQLDFKIFSIGWGFLDVDHMLEFMATDRFAEMKDSLVESRNLRMISHHGIRSPRLLLSKKPGFPPMNVYVSQDGVAITAELPGVAEDELEISVHRDTVTLSGERKAAEHLQNSDDKLFHRRERGRGRFSRTLSLPFQVAPENVEANLENGVLRLSLERPESDKPRRIQLKKR